MRGSIAGPVAWCLVSAALFGASTPLAKRLLAGLDPFTLAGLLYVGAAIAVAPMSFRGGSAARRADPSHMRYLLGAVLLGGIVGPVLLLFGLQYASSASVSLWLNLETVFTAVLAFVLFRESLGPRTWLAVACVVGAGVLLAFPFDQGTATAALLVAAACVCWGFDNNLTSLIDGYTPAQSTLVKGVIAGSVNLGIGAVVSGGVLDLDLAAAAVLVGGAGYGISIMLYIQGAQQVGATRSQMLFASAPLWGVLVAWTVLGEPVAWTEVAAIAPMLVGMALLVGSSHVHEHVHEPTRHAHSHRHDDGHHTHTHPGLPASARHTHEHEHGRAVHAHPHVPDLHHRHEHS